jgi:hypothetical protein
MFLVKSAFWLGLAFVVVQPLNTTLSANASVEPNLVATGQHVLRDAVQQIPCETLECAGGKLVILSSGLVNNPSQASSMQDSQALILAPVPRPRPVWAG